MKFEPRPSSTIREALFTDVGEISALANELAPSLYMRTELELEMFINAHSEDQLCEYIFAEKRFAKDRVILVSENAHGLNGFLNGFYREDDGVLQVEYVLTLNNDEVVADNLLRAAQMKFARDKDRIEMIIYSENDADAAMLARNSFRAINGRKNDALHSINMQRFAAARIVLH